jgi:hypothetical protein
VVEADVFVQDRISSDGKFHMETGVLIGNYIVTVCRGDEVLYHGVIRLRGLPSMELNIRIPSPGIGSP